MVRIIISYSGTNVQRQVVPMLPCCLATPGDSCWSGSSASVFCWQHEETNRYTVVHTLRILYIKITTTATIMIVDDNNNIIVNHHNSNTVQYIVICIHFFGASSKDTMIFEYATSVIIGSSDPAGHSLLWQWVLQRPRRSGGVRRCPEVKDGKMKPSMVRCDQGGHRDMWENWANNSSVLTENHWWRKSVEWGSPPFSDNAWYFLDRESHLHRLPGYLGKMHQAMAIKRIWNIMIWLVVWNMNGLSIYWECHHPNWRTHIFQRGRLKPPTRKSLNMKNISGMGYPPFSEPADIFLTWDTSPSAIMLLLIWNIMNGSYRMVNVLVI